MLSLHSPGVRHFDIPQFRIERNSYFQSFRWGVAHLSGHEGYITLTFSVRDFFSKRISCLGVRVFWFHIRISWDFLGAIFPSIGHAISVKNELSADLGGMGAGASYPKVLCSFCRHTAGQCSRVRLGLRLRWIGWCMQEHEHYSLLYKN